MEYNRFNCRKNSILRRICTSSYKELSQITSIKDDEKIPKAEEMINNLIEAHENIIQFIRDNFSIAEESNDEATIDLLTQRLDSHEKTAWMLRALLE